MNLKAGFDPRFAFSWLKTNPNILSAFPNFFFASVKVKSDLPTCAAAQLPAGMPTDHHHEVTNGSPQLLNRGDVGQRPTSPAAGRGGREEPGWHA